MTKPTVRTHHVANRLAHAIAVPGGMTIAEAIAKANAGVETVRDECMSALDAKIAEIDALAGVVPTEAGVNRIYKLGNEILGEAGAFGLSELSEAGRSLCDLTCAWRIGDKQVEAVRVHIAAMKALRRPEIAGSEATRLAVIEGLRAMTAKLAR